MVNLDIFNDNYSRSSYHMKSSIKNKDLLEGSSFIEEIAKGVRTLPLKKRMKFHKLILQTSITVIPLMMVSNRANAQMVAVDMGILEKAKGLDVLPTEILQLLTQLIVACGILGVLLSMLCLMMAGGFRMMGNTDKAKRWSVDIIKGLGQILLAPLAIATLVTLTSLILGNIDGLSLFY